MYRLIASKGCGSAVVEAGLVLANLPFTVDEIDYGVPGPDRDRLRALNPLEQVPTLVMPDGAVMTESAAMLLHLADVAPQAGLAPAAGDRVRPAFLRWLMFINAAIYPTYTYGDEPPKWVGDGDAGAILRERTDRHREWLWSQVESQIAPDPWFLGSGFTALDLYVAAMTRWRPRPAWFATYTPKLHAIASKTLERPALHAVWLRNFD